MTAGMRGWLLLAAVTGVACGDAELEGATATGGAADAPQPAAPEASEPFFDEALGVAGDLPDGWSRSVEGGALVLQRPDEPVGSGSVEFRIVPGSPSALDVDLAVLPEMSVAGRPARVFRLGAGPHAATLVRFPSGGPGWAVDAYVRGPESNEAAAARLAEVNAVLSNLRAVQGP